MFVNDTTNFYNISVADKSQNNSKKMTEKKKTSALVGKNFHRFINLSSGEKEREKAKNN